jgi:lipopolysaccharide transport system permease protein
MNERDEQIIEGRHRLFDWKELWNYNELFYFFTWRDITIKYKQTVLGLFWAIIQPLLMMLIFTFFFARALKIPSENLPYPVFVFSGLLLWNVFSVGLTNSANSMLNNAQIIKKIYFPRLIIPISSILVALFDFLMAFILFVPLLIYYKQPVSWNAIWSWPLAIVVCIIATLGPGCMLAALNIKYRDFRYVIPFVVQVLFFLSPVIYPVALVNDSALRYLLVCSPMFAAIELFRYPLTGLSIDPFFICVSIFSGLLLLGTGLTYFKRTEDFFADFA